MFVLREVYFSVLKFCFPGVEVLWDGDRCEGNVFMNVCHESSSLFV